MRMKFSRATFRGCAQNTIYPIVEEVACKKELEELARFDHVCGVFQNNHRGNEEFISANVLVMDCDNEHSDNELDWISPDDLEDWLGFEISYAVVCSRNHMRQKGQKSARPRFHVYFPVNTLTSARECALLKAKIQKEFPFFDPGAKDAARFIYGVENPEVLWHLSIETIDGKLSGQILEGNRNSTLSRFAAQKLVRYGNSDEAHQMFLDKAKECVPPLEERELNTIWASALRFYRKVENNPLYVPPEEYGNGFRYKPDDYSDLGMARLIESKFYGSLRYSSQTKFLYYEKNHWEESDVKARKVVHRLTDLQLAEITPRLAEVQKAFKDLNLAHKFTARRTLRMGETLSKEEEDIARKLQELKTYESFVQKYRDSSHISSCLKEAASIVTVEPSELDSDPFALNTPAGTVDLRTGDLREHDPNDLITKVTKVSCGSLGSEIWSDHLSKVFLNDQDIIDYVQEVCGLLAVGQVIEEKLYIAYGDGSNGKSTFWNTIARVLGEYSGKISTDALMRTNNVNVKNELAELKGKRIIIAGETENQRKLSPVVIKQVSSKDEIRGEKKYCDPMEFTPSHSVVLYTNHLPVVDDYDWGIWRRLCVIPFNASFNGASDIKNYDNYLFEHCGPSILSWIVDGAVRVLAKGGKPTIPKSVEEATRAYREDSDWLADFIQEECVTGPEWDEKAGDLWDRYKQYCEEHQERVKHKKLFKEALIAKGFSHKKKKNGAFYHGIRLKLDFE